MCATKQCLQRRCSRSTRPALLPNLCANCDFVAGVETQLQAHRLAKHLRNDKDRQQAAKQAAAEKKRMDEMTAAKQKAEDNTADAAGKQRKCTRGKGKDPCSNPQCTSSSKFGNLLTSEGWPLCNPCSEFPFPFHMLLRFPLTDAGPFGAQGRDGGTREERRLPEGLWVRHEQDAKVCRASRHHPLQQQGQHGDKMGSVCGGKEKDPAEEGEGKRVAREDEGEGVGYGQGDNKEEDKDEEEQEEEDGH